MEDINDMVDDGKQRVEDYYSMRNAMLLWRALRKERIREIYLCGNGFRLVEEKYPFMCKVRTSILYPRL